jgi:hypothetical protein
VGGALPNFGKKLEEIKTLSGMISHPAKRKRFYIIIYLDK